MLPQHSCVERNKPKVMSSSSMDTLLQHSWKYYVLTAIGKPSYTTISGDHALCPDLQLLIRYDKILAKGCM